MNWRLYMLLLRICRGKSGFKVVGCLENRSPKCDILLNLVHRAKHFDITLDHFRPETEHFWPTPIGSGQHQHVIHYWIQDVRLNIMIPHLTNYLK